MRISQETLRVLVGIIGGLVVVTRLYGVIQPEKMKRIAERLVPLGRGWVRTIYVIAGLAGVWIVYSALVTIFMAVPVFLVVSLLVGLLLLVSGVFVMHPEWFPQCLKSLLVDRSDFFVRFICLIGVLGGVFILLTAIFGNKWGG